MSCTTGRWRWSSTRSATSTGSSRCWGGRERGARWSLETHIHNDYVTGGYELARRTGAAYAVNAAHDEVAFDRTRSATATN